MNNMTNDILMEFKQILREKEFVLENIKDEETEFLIRNLVKYSLNNNRIEINADAFLNDVIQVTRK